MGAVEEVAEWIETEFSSASELGVWMLSNAMCGRQYSSKLCPLAKLMRVRARQPVEIAPETWHWIDRRSGELREMRMGPVAAEFRYEFDKGRIPALIGHG
jgi:hypothetical protein